MAPTKKPSTRKTAVKKHPLGGKILTQWKAPDYQPYEKNIRWYVTFCTLTFGVAGFIFWLDPATATVPVVSICVLAAFYLWVHKDGEKNIDIKVCETGLAVGATSFLPWFKFRGYWVLEDQVSHLLVLESKNWRQPAVRLQLGKTKTDKILKIMEKISQLEHLTEAKEGLFYFWSRVFRL